MTDTRTQPSCPACAVAFAGTRFGEKRGFVLWKCRSCGSVFVYPVPDTAAIGAVYGEAYFAGGGDCGGYADYDRDKRAMAMAFTDALSRLEALAPPGQKQVRRLLDVGTATGVFLELARARGWAVAGVELSDYAARRAREKGLDVHTGTMEGAGFVPGSFEAVTLWDVIEHVPDAASVLEAVRGSLMLGGIAAFTTPDASSPWARLLGARWQLLNPPEHLLCYSRAALTALLEQHGFSVERVSVPMKRFAIPYILHTAASWLGWGWLERLAVLLDVPWLRHFAVPLNLHDNMLIFARRTS